MTLPGSRPTDLARARDGWAQAAASFGVARDRAIAIREGLEARYRERHRAYHTSSHVAALAALAGAHRDLLLNEPVVTLAIWYHDAIYRPRRSDNEAASAKLADAELRTLGVPPRAVRDVGRLILATADHVPPADFADALPFLDFDLAILGSEPPVYEAYRQAIRREYRFVPRTVYRVRRRAVLARLLERPRIYRTDRFQQRLEEPARANLTRELLE
jgi:predicted metal-dependent HD superfamily phosphohydrolase